MGKVVLTLKGECITANKTANSSNIQIVDKSKVDDTQRGPIARKGITIVTPDNKAANAFDTTSGKKYTVTITED